jgi:hypothetical protein
MYACNAQVLPAEQDQCTMLYVCNKEVHKAFHCRISIFNLGCQNPSDLYGENVVGTVTPLLLEVPTPFPEAGPKFAQRLAPVSASLPQMHLAARQHALPNLGL